MRTQGTRRGTRFVVAATAALLTAPMVSLAGVAAAQQRPHFRTTVEVVQMQVAVADSRGDHIPGLTKDDFRLRVNGKVRDITAVYEVDLRPTPDPDLDEYMPPAGWRQWLLFFDFSFSTRRGILRARDTAREFVTKLTNPRDLIAVATYSTVGGLRLVSPFTADRGQVLDAIEAFGLNRSDMIVDPAGFAVQPIAELLDMETGNPEVVTDPEELQRGSQFDVNNAIFEYLSATQASDFRRYREEVVNYADGLRALGMMLRAAQGRKQVLLFSSGFDDKVLSGQTLDELANDAQLIQQGQSFAVNSETRFGSADLRDSLMQALENLRAADTVFHVVDTSGLGDERLDDTASATRTGKTFSAAQTGKQGLALLAEGTNGTIAWNANDLMPALADLAERTSRYYVLAYRKSNEDPDVVDIDVDVLRPGAKVVAAPRRLAPPPAYGQMDEAQRQLQLAEYISKGIEEENMIFDVRAVAFVGSRRISRVAVVVEVPFQQLEAIAAARGDGKAELDILGYIVDPDGQMRDLFSRRVALDVKRMSKSMAGLPFRYYDLLWALAGEHHVRVLVRDAKVGMLSTRTQTVAVPNFLNAQGLVVSGPVAVDAEHPGLIMRGLDPSSPPEHRQGGPVHYPFVIGDTEVTPEVYTLARPGGACHFMLVAHNLARHPFTGQVQTAVNAEAIDESGGKHALAGIQLVARSFDPETNATTMLFEAKLPGDLGAGAYLLQIDLIDAIAGQTVEQAMPFLVTSEGIGDAR